MRSPILFHMHMRSRRPASAHLCRRLCLPRHRAGGDAGAGGVGRRRLLRRRGLGGDGEGEEGGEEGEGGVRLLLLPLR